MWSLGAIIYEMLFARPPYMASNQFDLLNQIKKGPPSYPATNSSFSQGVIDLLKGLLQCEPEYRMNFVQFYNHYYLIALREEFGDCEELNTNILPPTVVEPTPQEPVINPNVVEPPVVDIVPVVVQEQTPPPIVQPIVPVVEAVKEFPITAQVKPEDILEEVPLEKIVADKLFISNPSEDGTSKPSQPLGGGNVVIIMDQRIPSDEAFKKTKEYSLDSVIGTNPTVIFDFSNLSCGEECRALLGQIEKKAKLAWFISETGLVMEKNLKYSEAYALYVRACILIRDCLTILKENVENNDRSQTFTILLRDWLTDFFTHGEAVQNKIITKEVDVNNIIYQMAIELAKEAAHKEYLGSMECIGLYVRAKHFLTYLMEESFSDKKKFNDFVENFNSRISYLEEQYTKANNL